MATILIGYDTESAAVGEGLARFVGPDLPQYLPALDPETTGRALETIARLHSEAEAPATLFLCGRTLVHSTCAIERAYATGLFDVQQHTYSHLLFRDVAYQPSPTTSLVMPASPPAALREELAFTTQLIDRYLGSEVVGLRTPFGFYRGLRDRPDALGLLQEAGIHYVSSWLRNEENANPTPWVQPFAYAEEGYPDILEIPAQFWLDAIWFDVHGWGEGGRFLAALRGAVDEVIERDLVFGVCFHDWTVLSADEEGTGWIGGLLAYARERDVEILSYTDFWRGIVGNQPPAPQPDG